MQSTGQGSRHFPHPEHSSGMMITSMPWLKIAPNWGGQCRMHVSQLMHSDISIRSGTFFHFGLRSRDSSRSTRVPAVMGPAYATPPSRLLASKLHTLVCNLLARTVREELRTL